MIATYAVTSSATQILQKPTGKPYKFVAISNNGNNAAYLKITGDATEVSDANGIILAAGSAVIFDQDHFAELLHSGARAISPLGTTLGVQAG